jgi:hypothetical protein
MSSFVTIVLGFDVLRLVIGLVVGTTSSFVGAFVLGFDFFRLVIGLVVGTMSSFVTTCGFVLGFDFLRLAIGLVVGTMSSFVGGFVLGTTSSFDGSVVGFELIESSVLDFGARDPLKNFPDFFVLTEGHPLPLPPPMFFFNQSLPLLTALSAICLVALFTLFANLSNIFEHGTFVLFIGDGVLLILLGFGFEDPLVLLLRGFVLEALDFFEPLVLFTRGFALITFVLFELVLLVIFFAVFPKLSFAFFLTADFNPSFGLFNKPFLPLQKLLSPFFRHCNPFLMAICFSFAAAAVLSAATPPVLTMAATVNPVLTIFPNFFSFFLKSTRLEGSDETI